MLGTAYAGSTGAARTALVDMMKFVFSQVSDLAVYASSSTLLVPRSLLTLTPVRHGATLPYRAISLPMAMLIPAAGHNVAHDSRLAA